MIKKIPKLISEQMILIERDGHIPLLIMTVCIQGGIIVSQFMTAFFITPSEMGIIRAIESVLSILILVGGLGMQSLSIREVAVNQDKINQINVLRNIYMLISLGALLTVFSVIIVRSFSNQSIMLDHIVMISGVVFIANAIRVTSGFAQGAGLVGKTYLHMMFATIASQALNVVVASQWGVTGWIIGRYISELITLTVIIWIINKLVGVFNHYAPISSKQIKQLLYDGFKINIALIVKLIGDNVPILMMVALKLPNDKIGFFGLAILAINSSMLPIVISAQRAFPKMSSYRFKPKELAGITKMLVKICLKLAFLSFIILFIGSILMYKILAGVYADAFLLTAVLCLTIPLKSIALAYGTNLVATNQMNAAVKINLLEVMITIILGLIAIKIWDMFGLVCAIFLANLWSAIAHYAFVESAHNKIDCQARS